MKSVWHESDRRELRDRLARLTPQHQRRWGKMSSAEMVAHLVEAMRMALGDLVIPSKNLPLRFTPLKQLFVYAMPFPKGAPTAPELVARAPADWRGDCAALETLLERFAQRDPRGRDWPQHPAFGNLSSRAWGVLVYKHMDHHLRQFGV